MNRKEILLILAAALFVFVAQSISEAADPKMYWTQGRKILRGNPGDTNVETLATGRNPSSLALDVAGNRMYWIDHAYNSIFKATLDGKNVEKLITGLSNTPGTIALDIANNKIYWTDPGNKKISRANLDGSGVLDLVEGQSNLYGIALDIEADKMYWTHNLRLHRANLDGSDSEVIITVGYNYGIYGDIALDTIVGKIYFYSNNVINRVNLNGSDREGLVGASHRANFSLDIENGKIYWTDPGNKKISRANLDGSDSETLAADLSDLKGITLDIPLETSVPSPPLSENATKMYWTQGNKILRGNPYDTNVETLATGRNPSSLALDVAGNRMYWIDHAYNSIFKATLDGKNVEKLITGLSNTPGTIALDVANNKIYWTDPDNKKISRANLDGSGVLDLVESQSNLYGIALDIEAGKMYWTHNSRLHRANLDGSDSEVIITVGYNYGIYGDIALDTMVGKIYFYSNNVINRVNLNGSDREGLVGASHRANFSLDIENGKIYWTDPDNKKIRRANLDGTSVHNLFTGLNDLKGITLDIPLETSVPSPPLSENATKMYWTQGNKILRGNPYDTNVETLATGRNPSSLALDVAGNRMYWIDHAYNSIFKATLDGKNVEKLITGLSNTPGTIALDVANNKIYWTDPDNKKISRANLDGSDSEIIIEGQNNLYGLALDVEAGKMYWTHNSRLHRANLDGSDSEVIITVGYNYGIYGDIALDTMVGKIYFYSNNVINRVNLNGSDREGLVGASHRANFSLDIENGKIYWTDPDNKKIRRANLDGTSAHNLFTGLDDLRDIALDPSAPPPTVPAVNGSPTTDPTVSVTSPTEPEITTQPLATATDLDLDAHDGDVRCIAYSPWGVVLASGGTDDTLRLWRTSTGELLNTYLHSGDVNSIAFSPNDTWIASGSDDGKLRLFKWNQTVDTWVIAQILPIPGGALTNNVRSVAFSHDNTMLACGTSGNEIHLWDYNPDNEKYIYRTQFEGHAEPVNSVAFSPYGVVLASASDDDTVRLWRARNGQALDTLSAHTADVNSVTFSRDDAFIATGSDDDTVILWKWSVEADTWVHHKTLDHHDSDVRSVAFNPSGSVLISASADKTIGVCDGRTGDYQALLREHTDAVNSVAFSFQGNAIASGSDDGTVKQLTYTEDVSIADKGSSLTLPPNLISDVAFGTNATYFVLNAQFPTLTGVNDADVFYDECTITLDLPGVPGEAVGVLDRENPRLDNPGYYMFLIKTPRTKVGDATAESANALAGALPVVGSIVSTLTGIVEGSQVFEALKATADPETTITNPWDTYGYPKGRLKFLVLVQNQVTGIGIKMELKYQLKSAARKFWFDPTYTATYSQTVPLTVEASAAPSAQAIRLADYPPFQMLPPKVQEYLLRHFGELMNTSRDWQIPEETSLLPNYPNPFNPETWIPYQLAKPADVKLTIYDIQGRVVRHLDLGHQRAGMYHSRNRAAYWDGRNAQGEPVASGVYFYTL